MIKSQYRSREKVVTEQYNVYITSDGNEFLTMSKAYEHERQLNLKAHDIKEILVRTCDDDYAAHLYHFNSYQDFKYMGDTEWDASYTCKWADPGWYLVVRHDGGDSPDWFEINYMPYYLDDIKSWIKDIEEKMSYSLVEDQEEKEKENE